MTPVLTFGEAPDDPHLAARDTLIEIDGVRPTGSGAAVLPHAGGPAVAAAATGAHTAEVLADWCGSPASG